MDIGTVGVVAEQVNPGKRAYRSPGRAAAAAATRHAVLVAARTLFVERGYAATTVAQIARTAGVAVDTVYAAVGTKPVLLRELVETALSGVDEAVPAQQRDYVLAVRAAVRAEDKIAAYCAALPALQLRLAPVFLALRDAGLTDPVCAALWQDISARRARNMLQFAADLRSTGQLREDLSDQEVADVIWSMNAVEYWVLLVRERGWSPDRFGTYVADAWRRLLLQPST